MRLVQTAKKHLDPYNIQNIEITYLIMTSKVKVTVMSFFFLKLIHWYIYMQNLQTLDPETKTLCHVLKVRP
jgi:hypothetical protein